MTYRAWALSRREIGAVGTLARLACAAILLWMGVLDVTSRPSGWHDAVLGLIVFPAIVVGLVLAVRRHGGGPIRLTGPLGTALNCGLILALVFDPYTSGPAVLFYGSALLLTAARGQPDCEATVVSNLILGRDDRIGCPIFTPLDRLEARQAQRAS